MAKNFNFRNHTAQDHGNIFSLLMFTSATFRVVCTSGKYQLHTNNYV